jgi:hypothetical protein
MNEQTIIIAADKYDELVRTAERIEVVKRLLASDRYTCLKDVKIVLGIEEKEESEDEAV